VIRSSSFPCCPVIWVAVILRIIDAFRSLEVMFIMTFGARTGDRGAVAQHLQDRLHEPAPGTGAVNAIFLLAFILVLSVAF